MTKHLTWIAAAALVVTLGACTEHKIYRSDLSLCTSADPNDDWSNRCRTNALQTFETTGAGQETYSLGFIEFDDQGQLWNRKQMDELVLVAVPMAQGRCRAGRQVDNVDAELGQPKRRRQRALGAADGGGGMGFGVDRRGPGFHGHGVEGGCVGHSGLLFSDRCEGLVPGGP